MCLRCLSSPLAEFDTNWVFRHQCWSFPLSHLSFSPSMLEFLLTIFSLGQNLGKKGPANGKKIKISKSPVWGTRYHCSNDPNFIKIGLPFGSLFAFPSKNGDRLDFPTFCRKCAHSSLLHPVISWEPFRIEEKVRPFCVNYIFMAQNRNNQNFDPGPPSPLKQDRGCMISSPLRSVPF